MASNNNKSTACSMFVTALTVAKVRKNSYSKLFVNSLISWKRGYTKVVESSFKLLIISLDTCTKIDPAFVAAESNSSFISFRHLAVVLLIAIFRS